jgi:hypothetical protein
MISNEFQIGKLLRIQRIPSWKGSQYQGIPGLNCLKMAEEVSSEVNAFVLSKTAEKESADGTEVSIFRFSRPAWWSEAQSRYLHT